jgi:hypothetical protein
MPVSRLPVVYSVLAIIFFLTLQLASRNLHQTLHLRQTVEHVDIPIFEPPAKPQSGPITIAYVVSVTSCKKRELVMDGASVLQHSIYLSSLRAGQSKYDYQMIALVLDPDGKECIDILEYLNYTIHLKTVPFSISNIRGEFRNWANRTGCCGEKEWIKLYAYTLQQYPIVVHLDLDCLVLKPLDKLFNAMLYGERQGIPAMWLNDSSPDWPETIDAFFTRDYGMIGVPGRRKPHQIGVQGGFLVLRPNQTVFDEYIDLILEGTTQRLTVGVVVPSSTVAIMVPARFRDWRPSFIRIGTPVAPSNSIAVTTTTWWTVRIRKSTTRICFGT